MCSMTFWYLKLTFIDSYSYVCMADATRVLLLFTFFLKILLKMVMSHFTYNRRLSDGRLSDKCHTLCNVQRMIDNKQIKLSYYIYNYFQMCIFSSTWGIQKEYSTITYEYEEFFCNRFYIWWSVPKITFLYTFVYA